MFQPNVAFACIDTFRRLERRYKIIRRVWRIKTNIITIVDELLALFESMDQRLATADELSDRHCVSTTLSFVRERSPGYGICNDSNLPIIFTSNRSRKAVIYAYSAYVIDLSIVWRVVRVGVGGTNLIRSVHENGTVFSIFQIMILSYVHICSTVNWFSMLVDAVGRLGSCE